MGLIARFSLIKMFQRMYTEHWKYRWGAAEDGCVDCSGAFVYAYKKFGKTIAHGSNAIARKYVRELLPISQAVPGMAAFKLKKPGDGGYDLPDKYRQGGSDYNGNLNDYYHIGLVDSTGKFVLNAQSPSAGFTKTPIEKWQAVGYLNAVSYADEKPDTEGKATVVAVSGKTVNVRSAPKGNARIENRLPIGTEVYVLQEEDGWCKIEYTLDGWMKSEFLEL